MSDKEFDSLSYETVANQFGIADVNLSFNEQITNAIVTLARIKAGAGDQELGFLANIKNGILYQSLAKKHLTLQRKCFLSLGTSAFN
jgi:hypothetical protein